ncbi:UNVERIFIED_CONTAM: putative ribonuclease H protein [Sesamum angustifolium]|uniref:Ribonuclease H protein n=1 Tax=Sesamum angustifolium TaxID=2727405 RepID=A0AAW2K0T6_9LAMI
MDTNGATPDEIIDKGKSVVVYNPFDVLLLADDDAGIWNVRGLNRRDHQVAVKELVSEFRLQFLGLLETRVSAVNVSRIQNFLPHWSWFTDYNGPGNRIWLAWDDELLDVHVLDLDVQFIHCRISIRSAHLSVLATVVYGANDTIADIQLAMTEFRDCILDTGLIHLPVQGERFSWHNCSEGDRSLWKRLDRLMVNDAWLGQWPCSHYHCLNARTSDHSPLVIRGDTISHTVMLQQRAKIQWLKGGDQCSRIFFRKVAMRRASKKRLLGGERRREYIDLRYLRPWARHVVTPAECTMLVQRPTREEVKDAFFDIAEDKAPGPDGYSSGFYKAAWPVIGDEVFNAILEFFTTGRLLKQVNTTLLALIPKRLRLVLDAMISPSQNAFVPGRSIGDNILLAQEMFTGYNRQGLPKRCALKVDLRKAYDTVEWDFLIAALQLFGFPDIFIGWIEECVTTPMFSLMMQQLIDQNEGFSYHWRCKELGLFQLCFADDLLLFCKAEVASVQVFRRGLDDFAKLSGLHANPQKSQLILSRAQKGGQLPSPPLPSAFTGSPLLLKVDSRIRVGIVQLSFAGRLQLIKSVLMSLDVYWAMAFILPKGVIREVEKRMRNFLWKGNSTVGYPKVAWSSVCRPKEEGGLGIRDILALNKALMCRHLWNVIQGNQSSIWVRWIAHNHLRHKSVWTVEVKGGSWGWRKLLRLRSALLPYIELKIGDGESFSLWHDPGIVSAH